MTSLANNETSMGEVLRDGERIGLRFVRRFAHPLERVWSAITESDQLQFWMPCDIVGISMDVEWRHPPVRAESHRRWHDTDFHYVAGGARLRWHGGCGRRLPRMSGPAASTPRHRLRTFARPERCSCPPPRAGIREATRYQLRVVLRLQTGQNEPQDARMITVQP
jgi:hypothetical protein